MTTLKLPAGMVRAGWLIEANIRQHSVDGYTAWHMVADAHERTIREMADELNIMRGVNLIPSRGCSIVNLLLGPLEVPVEYEYERGQREITQADPDKCQEGIPPSVTILRVYLQGQWCDAEDVVCNKQIEMWTEQILEGAQ
jgi:hypothetical protein